MTETRSLLEDAFQRAWLGFESSELKSNAQTDQRKAKRGARLEKKGQKSRVEAKSTRSRLVEIADRVKMAQNMARDRHQKHRSGVAARRRFFLSTQGAMKTELSRELGVFSVDEAVPAKFCRWKLDMMEGWKFAWEYCN